MAKKVLKIFEYVLIVIFILIIIFLGYYIISKLVNKDKPVKMFGYYSFEVISDSMYNEESEHSIARGDLIFVKPLKDEEYEVGMVVTYFQENSTIPITHMIVERNGNTIITRGINKEGNTSDDAPFDVSMILGEVKGVWRNYKSFVNWTTSPIGFICIILVGFLLVEGLTVLNKSIDKKAKKS